MKTYEPRKDLLYAILSILSVLLLLAIYTYSNHNPFIGLLTLGFTLLHLYQWKSTVYRIRDDVLHIRSGILQKHIPIHTIDHIELVHNFDILATLSYRKLKLNIKTKDKTKVLYVSPSQFNRFIEDIAKRNPLMTISDAVKEQCLLEIYEVEMS